MAATATIHCTDLMRDHLIDGRRQNTRRIFAYPAGWTGRRGWQLGVFIAEVHGQRCVIAIGLVHPGRRVGDYERGLNVDAVRGIDPLPTTALTSILKGFSDALSKNGPLSEARGDHLRNAIISEHPQSRTIFEHLEARLTSTIEGARGEMRAWEKDATGLILETAGISRDVLREWLPTSDDAPFIAGLPNEDQLIAHDHGTFMDWEPSNGRQVGFRLFTKADQRLWVYVSNRRASETALGMDLIYYHENNESFALVQYKRMDEGSDGWGWRPDSHIEDQLAAMRVVDEECMKHADDSMRLVPTPSLVKLCKAGGIQSDSSDLIKGMYFTRPHFEKMMATCTGPRGGTRINYKNVPRYLNNTMFTELLRDGWLGSSRTGSDYVKQLIAKLERGDRSLAVGVQTSLRQSTSG